MDKKTHKHEAIRQRLHSSEWNQSIGVAVDNARKQRRKRRIAIVTAFSLLIVASFSIGAFVVAEENASAQMYTMLEQLTNESLPGSFLE